jgi:hypothetical protein
MGDNRTLLSRDVKKFMGVVMIVQNNEDQLLTLPELCTSLWPSKTPGAIKADICRGKDYPFLFKIGKSWVTYAGAFSEWYKTQKKKQTVRR